MTKDFLYDLLEGLEKQETQYILSVHQPKSPDSPLESYFFLNNKKQAQIAIEQCMVTIDLIKKEFKIK